MNYARWRPIRPMVLLVLLIAALVLFTGSVQAMTRSLARIENRAMATYSSEEQSRTTWSNQVTVMVSQVAGVEVSPTSMGQPGQPRFSSAHQQQAVANQRVSIPYQVINTGNGPDTYHLSVRLETDGLGSPPPLLELGIYHDRNEDGFVDPHDPELQEIALEAGESASIIVSLRLSLLAMEGMIYFTALQATSAADPSVSVANTWSATQVCAGEPVLVVRRSLEVTPRPTHPPAQGGGGHVAGQGAVLTHTIMVDNLGYSPTTDVHFREKLDLSERLLVDAYRAGKSLLVSGTPLSLDPTIDPQARLVVDDDGHQVIEITFPQIESTQRILVQYQVELDWRAEQDHIRKVTRLLHTGWTGELLTHSSNELLIRKEGGYAVQVTPKGAITVPGEPDLQVQPLATPGQRLLFHTTIHNTGSLPGVVELRPMAPLPAGWTVEFYAANGVTPLLDSSHNGTVDLESLVPGGQQDIAVVVTVPSDPAQFAAPPYMLVIEAFFAEATQQSAKMRIRIDTVKTIDDLWDPLLLTVDVRGVVVPESLLTYTCIFGNASGVNAGNVIITEELSPYLSPPLTWSGQVGPMATMQGMSSSFAAFAVQGISGVYDPLTHSIVWTVPLVLAGEGGKLVFQAIVKGNTPEGKLIQVRGRLVSTVNAAAAISNVVSNLLVRDDLVVDLWAARPVVSVGETNTYYIDVTNLNTKAALEDVDVVVVLPPSLAYRAGSLSENGVHKAEPLLSQGTLRYHIDRLEKGSTVHLILGATVTAAAESELVVGVEASMPIKGKPAVFSPPAEVRTIVSPGVFGSAGLIVGQLLTKDGLPVAGVRVILDNGHYAVSDQKGLFTFEGVKPGTRLVRLDPVTLRESHLGEPEPKLARLIVPAGGIATAEFTLPPAIIEVVTLESLLEGEGL